MVYIGLFVLIPQYFAISSGNQTIGTADAYVITGS